MITPISPMLEHQGFVLLDGGLATELESRGYDLNHPLWSARLLLDEPDAIRETHRSYLASGADCLTTASYQASIPGLVREGLSEMRARELITNSVAIACGVRDEFVEKCDNDNDPALRPLVAASVGPYGACLADGSEYVGNYGISQQELRAFHLPRWAILHDAGADLLACETIPSLLEAEVLRELIDETPDCRAWISFSCRDGEHISDGTPLSQCAALFEDCEQVIAVGINCTAPQFVSSLIGCVRTGAPSKQIVVYPNSGKTYNAELRRWDGVAAQDFGSMARQWLSCGANLIGGCCGTGPQQIKEIRDACGPANSVDRVTE